MIPASGASWVGDRMELATFLAMLRGLGGCGSGKDRAMDYEGDGRTTAGFEVEGERRAAAVGVADMSEQLAAGLLRALDARQSRVGPGTGGGRLPPWVWCGIWVLPSDQLPTELISRKAEAQAFEPE